MPEEKCPIGREMTTDAISNESVPKPTRFTA